MRTTLSSLPGEVTGDRLTSRIPLWCWLLGPYLFVLLAGLLLPLSSLAVLSVFRHDVQNLWAAVLTFQNYARLFDAYFIEILVRTLRIGLITTVICAALAVPLAYWLSRCSRSALSIGLFLVVMPMMVSTVIRSFGWMIILGRSGIINSVSVELGIGRWLFIMNTEPAVIIALVQICLPLMVLPTMAAMEKIPVLLEEAATNLGANALQLFRRVILPLAVPGLASGALLSFVVAISVVVTPALMGGRSTRMLGNEIYDQVISAMNWPMASAISITLILLVCVLLALSSALGRYLSDRTVRST